MKFWNTNLLESPRDGELFYTYHPYVPQTAKEAILKTRNINGFIEIYPKIDGYKQEDYKIYAWAKSDLDLDNPEVFSELDEVHNEFGKPRYEEVQKICKDIEDIGK